MSSLFIDDGYSTTRTIPAVAGLHPELLVVYRPALSRERIVYRQKMASPDPTVLDGHEAAMVLKYLVSLNGQQLTPDQVQRLRPAVRAYVIDLVLGYTPADEAADAKNSPSASG